MFRWAEFRRYKGGIKLQDISEIKSSILSFMHIKAAGIRNINIMVLIDYGKGGLYVADKAYTDLN